MRALTTYFGVVLILISSPGAHATDLPDFPFLISEGKAVRQVQPDMATLNITLFAFDSDPEIAARDLSSALDSCMEILGKYHVPNEFVKASDLRRSITRARNSDYQSLEILGYELSRTLFVELDDLSSFPAIAGEIAASQNLSRVDTKFDVSNREQIEEELLAVASADAMRKARLVAKGFNQEIDSVYAISQVSSFDGFFATYGALSHRSYLADMSPMDSGASDSITMFVPESIIIRESINVVLRIKD